MSDEQGTAVEDPDGEASATEANAEASNDESAAADPPIEKIADRIETDAPTAIAEEIATLREEAATLRRERDDLESRLKRKQAEFQNYKKRQQDRLERQRARATEDLVEDLLEVRDNLSRALEQDENADIREGVEATFRGLDDVLDGQGVEPIEPEPGTETDPKRHEVLLRVKSDEPAGTVAELHRPGHEMAGKVLRTAQVTVADGSSEPDEDETEDGESNDDETGDTERNE
jgi:molecular chaperone GrpE